MVDKGQDSFMRENHGPLKVRLVRKGNNCGSSRAVGPGLFLHDITIFTIVKHDIVVHDKYSPSLPSLPLLGFSNDGGLLIQLLIHHRFHVSLSGWIFFSQGVHLGSHGNHAKER